MPIYGAPFTMYGYQLQIYGCRRMESNMSTASCFNMSLKQLLVWPVENDMLKNGVKYLKTTIYGAPFSIQRYQLKIYGYSTIKSNISTASSCNTSLKQLLVWPVDKYMLKNGVKYHKIPIYGAPLLRMGINCRFMVVGEWNVILQLISVL